MKPKCAPLIREKQPLWLQTFGKVGNIRVRNAATVGGNLSEADYASDPPCVLVALAREGQRQER